MWMVEVGVYLLEELWTEEESMTGLVIYKIEDLPHAYRDGTVTYFYWSNGRDKSIKAGYYFPFRTCNSRILGHDLTKFVLSWRSLMIFPYLENFEIGRIFWQI